MNKNKVLEKVTKAVDLTKTEVFTPWGVNFFFNSVNSAKLLMEDSIHEFRNDGKKLDVCRYFA